MSNVKKQAIIILHGWGLEGSKYKNLAGLLEKNNFFVLSPDLPGFGRESLISSNMNLDGYVQFLDDFLKENKVLNPILIGHSFGGRIAIKYTWHYPKKVDKLILTGVPIIRDKSFLKKIWFVSAVMGGKIFRIFPDKISKRLRKILYFVIGEWDYYKSGSLKEVFKNIVNEDLIRYVSEIKIPILLVWGRKDLITPVSDVYKIKNLNKLIEAVIIDGIGHKLPYEKPFSFFQAIKSYI